MVRISSSHLTLILVSGLCALTNVACHQSNAKQQEAASPSVPSSPSPNVVAASPSAAQAKSPPAQDVYNTALAKANSARNISQSALSEDDWNLVASRWEQAIASLKAVPSSSPYFPNAKTKLAEFQKGLANARKQASQAKNTGQGGSNPGLIAGNDRSLNVTSNVTSGSPGSGKIYRAAIKRRAGGTPVIDVTFNGNQTFEMIVDTGASGTVITQKMANALVVRVIGKTKVNTASQTNVEVPLGYVDSIAVGGAVVKEVIVAIANDALDIGLLGHDFFSDYDVTVKQDVVEFRRR
jgi:predicted aspartyl protease